MAIPITTEQFADLSELVDDIKGTDDPEIGQRGQVVDLASRHPVW